MRLDIVVSLEVPDVPPRCDTCKRSMKLRDYSADFSQATYSCGCGMIKRVPLKVLAEAGQPAGKAL